MPSVATGEMGRRGWISSRALLLAVAIAIFALDQASKLLLARYLTGVPGHSVPLIPHVVWLTLITNTGAAFGILANQSVLFVLIALVVIVVILIYWRYVPSDRLWVQVALGLQLGGATGNLLDRLRYGGQVIDFIDLKFWPVFNLADSAIVVGVTILAIYLFFNDERRASSPSFHANETGC